MVKDDSKNVNRRDFIVSGLRTLALGGIVSVSGILGWRQMNAEENGLCTIVLPCQGCSKFTGCADPKITAYKQQIKEESELNSGLKSASSKEKSSPEAME